MLNTDFMFQIRQVVIHLDISHAYYDSHLYTNI